MYKTTPARDNACTELGLSLEADMTATLEEIDEALSHSAKIPLNERGTVWQAWVDKLLEQRNQLTNAT